MVNRSEETRINVRISDRDQHEAMLILAYSLGLSKTAWARATLIRELTRSNTDEIFQLQILKSLLTLQSLVENERSENEVRAARKKADDYIERVQSRDD